MKSSIILCRAFTGVIISFTSLLFLFCVCSCNKWDAYEKTEEATLSLCVYEGDNPLGNPVKYYVQQAEGATKWFPLIFVREDNDWGLESGYEYKVSVWKHWRKADESSSNRSIVEFEFRKVLSKKEVRLLTMDDILWNSIFQ